MTVKRTIALAAMLGFCIACSRLQPLTVDGLMQAEAKWRSQKRNAYHLVIEMSGDRVETGRFDVNVLGGKVISLRRNNLVIVPGSGQDYSMDGLFHMLEQELGLAERPSMLGAPEGYSVYLNARFDDATGRLIHYRRIVGGTSNSIDVNIVSFDGQ